jgi:hypothetical protein
MPQILETGVDALELHTQVGRLDAFRKLWQAVHPWLDQLKLIAISCPDGAGAVAYLWSLYREIAPLPCPLIWQADGRSMSGDIGAGTTHATIQFAQKLLATGPPGYVQLAGGTNGYTVKKVQALQLLGSKGDLDNPGEPQIAGIAYGSYARRWLSPSLEPCTATDRPLETMPQCLHQAVAKAQELVFPLKQLALGPNFGLPGLNSLWPDHPLARPEPWA